MRIAVPVPSLVVVEDRGHGRVHPLEPSHDPRAVLRMAFHDLELELREAGRLREDRVRNADLADVVEKPGEAEDVEAFRVKPKLLADCDGDPAHALGVPRRVRILRVDRRVEAFDSFEGALLEETVRLDERRVLAPERARGAADEQHERRPESEKDAADE